MSKFPGNVKLADITPLYKKCKKDIKRLTLPISKFFSKFFKIVLKTIFPNRFFDITFFMHLSFIFRCTNMDLGKVLVANIVF